MKIKNESQLLEILKIYAQESVRKAKKTLNENVDSAIPNYHKGIKAAEAHYNVKLTEQEDEEQPAETEEEPPPEEEAEVPAESEEQETSTPENFSTSFDSVVKAINNLRAGRSTKDKEIKTELLGYYDRLSEEERQVLQIFLKELSRILQGAIDGADAIDPSDPPLYAKIILKQDEEEPESAPEPEAEEEPEEDDVTGGEDTTPPIKVGGQQNLQEIRKKVRRLMKRL